MLRHKDGMAAKRGLLAVIGDNGRGQALCDEILCMRKHDRQTLFAQVIAIFSAQLKATAEAGCFQRGKKIVQIAHAQGIRMPAPVVLRASMSR